MLKLLLKLLKLFSGTKEIPSEKIFVDVLKEYIDKKSVESCLTESAIKKNEYAYNNITLFLHSQEATKMTLTEVRAKTMESLKYWLHKNLVTCSAEHTSRHINLCKAAMRYAIRMEYIVTSSIEAVETKRDKPKDVVYLNENEIKKLAVYQFPKDVHRITADLYLFQSFTGLSYADLYRFKIIREGGMNWIVGEAGREKNGVAYHVPLFDAAQELLSKYNGQMPYLCNQTYNRNLKNIARMLNINKKLTTHTARKTFATLKDQEGWSIDSIADMMGNTPEIARKHYINHSKKRVESEFLRLAV
jgi:integrase